MSFDTGALRVTILTLHKLGISERRAAVEAANAAGKILQSKVIQNISLRDHTLAQLAAMDHPYARRHGSIRIHRKGSTALVHPEYRVHTQSGALLNAVRVAPASSRPHWRLWLDKGVAPHAEYVIHGTRVMLPRDVLWDTAKAPAVQRSMMKAITRRLGRGLRTGAALRFGDTGKSSGGTIV
jgi:hypothetical protein